MNVNSFKHEAVLYADEDEFLTRLMPHVERALNDDDAVLVAVPQRRIELMRSELGADAGDVRFADIQAVGRNPGRIIPLWREFADAHAGPGRRPLGIGEPVWAGRRAEEIAECRLHEALLNTAFDGPTGWDLLCPYDTAALGADVIQGARCSHPKVSTDGLARHSPDYEPVSASAALSGSLPAPPPDAAEIAVDADRLHEVRRFAMGLAGPAGFDRTRAEDLVLAVTELATNTVRHGGGRGHLRAWREDGDLVCEASDAGRFADPLVGRRRAGLNDPGGRGLWLVNSLCDLVQIRNTERGAVVRIRFSPALEPVPPLRPPQVLQAH